MMVEIGLDRMHHAFWRFLDPEHPRYEPDHRYRDAIRNYYAYLDEQIGELLERFDEETTMLVVSDHGARPMLGAICVNEWLVQKGYLVLEEEPLSELSPSRLEGRLEPDAGLGRGRLLLPAVPQRRRAGAAGDRPGRATARRCCDELAGRLEQLPGPDGSRSARRAPPAGAVARAARDPAGPDRLLRRPRLAQQRQPRPRPALDASRTTPVRTTPTTTATGSV